MKRMSKKLLWFIPLGVIVIVMIVITIINSTYHGDNTGSANMLEAGEKSSIILHYNDVEEELEYTAYEEFELPTPECDGYNFVGWSSSGAFYGKTAILNSKEQKDFWAIFEKDYSNITSPVALYTDEDTYTEYAVGEYPQVNQNISIAYISGGYKVELYSKENFEGDVTNIVYEQYYDDFTVGSMKVIPVESQGIKVNNITDDDKANLLYTFAPRIWWAQGEEYFATTVEDAMANMDRAMTDNGYSYIISQLDSPDYMDDYLYGSLDNAKAYAFATEKDGGYLDLSYFIFTPYNKAKTILGVQFGNHIGDWEHVTIRLMQYSENGDTYYRPIIVDYSTHDYKNFAAWDDVEKIDDTHPVAFTALGSHGMWQEAGTHVYVNAIVVKLTDECSQGTAWDLWLNDSLETYAYDSLNHSGKGIGDSQWNTCFDFDRYDEDSNAVYSWGNKGWYSPIQIYPQLDSGPRGPQNKVAMYDYYTLEW